MYLDKKLKAQTEYDVLYYQTYSYDGANTVVESENQFNKLKKQSKDLYFNVTTKAITELKRKGGKNKKFILIGINVDNTAKEEANDSAYDLNHEENHAESTLDGNHGDPEKNAKDHANYYGEKTNYSPDDEEVKTNPKYRASEALKQIKEIDKIIKEKEYEK